MLEHYKVRRIESIEEKKEIIIKCDNAFEKSIAERDNFDDLLNKIHRAAIFVAACGNDVYGYAAMYANDYRNKEAYITLFAVRPDMKRMRVGSNLLKACVDIALEQGMKAIKLEVRNNNSTAIQFYKSNGFEYEKACSQESIYMCRRL